MFGSLDYVYVPAADVDGEALRYVETLGAELVWKVRGMETTVACLRVADSGAVAIGTSRSGGNLRRREHHRPVHAHRRHGSGQILSNAVGATLK